jgi:serine/threonine protein kinase
VKPENVILDEEGHAHLTDFNIATILEEGEMAVSISGTKPYMGNSLTLIAPLAINKLIYGPTSTALCKLRRTEVSRSLKGDDRDVNGT